MLERILRHINNWFDRDPVKGYVNVVRSTFTVSDGVLGVPDGFIQDGQYFRIKGSTFNDGLHKAPCSDLTDETFYGLVYGLKIPNDFLALVQEIEAWQADYEAFCAKVASLDDPYKSESFGGYTYTKQDVPMQDEIAEAWQSAFAVQLRRYRKINSL